eukprot:1497354-Rhodomonas_salina.1
MKRKAAELVKAIFSRHKVSDPIKVDQDATPEEWEEKWQLERDSRDIEGEAVVHKLANKFRGVNRERAISGADPILFADPGRALRPAPSSPGFDLYPPFHAKTLQPLGPTRAEHRPSARPRYLCHRGEALPLDFAVSLQYCLPIRFDVRGRLILLPSSYVHTHLTFLWSNRSTPAALCGKGRVNSAIPPRFQW